jgi:hypothetical protein
MAGGSQPGLELLCVAMFDAGLFCDTLSEGVKSVCVTADVQRICPLLPSSTSVIAFFGFPHCFVFLSTRACVSSVSRAWVVLRR